MTYYYDKSVFISSIHSTRKKERISGYYHISAGTAARTEVGAIIIVIEVMILENETDSPAPYPGEFHFVQVSDILSFKEHPAFCGYIEATYHIHGRGFPAPAQSHDCQEFFVFYF